MRKILFFAIALVASALVFVACDKKDGNDPEISPEYFEGYWHLDSMSPGGIRPIKVTLINDTVLSIDAEMFKEPGEFKWSHKDGKINAPWIWSAPMIYVDYTVVSVNNDNAVIKKESDGMLLYFTHILVVHDQGN